MMRIYEGLDSCTLLPNAVVTSGTFDGVHIGHQKILKRLIQRAQENNGEAMVITFWPHPRFVLHPEDSDLKLLSTFNEKTTRLAELGIHHLLKIPFTTEFSQLSSEDFIQKVLVDGIGTRTLVIGYDHRFGKNREGSFEYLSGNAQKYGFEVEEIPREELHNIGISSTKIRKALLAGDLVTARQFLGENYSITGTVTEGSQMGRSIGFPTANMMVKERYKLVPGDGAYAVEIQWQGQAFQGMLNIGFRPTVYGNYRTIESHIFDFDRQIYGDDLTVTFVSRMRSETKFESLDQLKDQLIKDRLEALRILNQTT